MALSGEPSCGLLPPYDMDITPVLLLSDMYILGDAWPGFISPTLAPRCEADEDVKISVSLCDLFIGCDGVCKRSPLVSIPTCLFVSEKIRKKF